MTSTTKKATPSENKAPVAKIRIGLLAANIWELLPTKEPSIRLTSSAATRTQTANGNPPTASMPQTFSASRNSRIRLTRESSNSGTATTSNPSFGAVSSPPRFFRQNFFILTTRPITPLQILRWTHGPPTMTTTTGSGQPLPRCTAYLPVTASS
jgi:hypothetical protein